jgi:hypothetical protein
LPSLAPAHDPPTPNGSPRQRSTALRIILWATAAAVVLLLIAGIVTAVLLHRAQPILRARVIDTLSSRLQARVELDSFDVSVTNGFEVSGTGLRITPYSLEDFPPVITADKFAFHMFLTDLLSASHHVRVVRVEGLHILLPPHPDQPPSKSPQPPSPQSPNSGQTPPAASPAKKDNHPFPKLFADEFICNNATLTRITEKPGKVPLQFLIQNLHLTADWTTGALHYTAALENPKPVGEIHSTGTFGPWNDANPRTTPITGDFSFDHADLSTIKGIAGILSSAGHFSGPLDHLTVDGRTSTPDFRIDESGHPVNLTTTFHAIVDGSTGDTYLQPVNAHFRNTWFTCTGSVVDEKGVGHHISLDAVMRKARIEDLLYLGVKTMPPVITGDVVMHTALVLPPDPSHSITVARRLNLNGNFNVTDVRFSNPDTDKKVDSISLRTQGKVDQSNQVSKSPGPDNIDLYARLNGNFTLGHGVITLTPAEFRVPGLLAEVNGTYAIDGSLYDFSGTARLDVTISKLFTGWKSLLLKPVDPFFKKGTQGAVIPFHIGGTRNDPKFSLEFGHHAGDPQPPQQPPLQ